MSELYYDRIVIIPIFLLPFILLLNGIITSWYYYRVFVIRNSTITKYIQYRMNYYWMTPLPISTITKVFHPRIVPIPNATITELRITELFYYGLLLPNVAHSSRIHHFQFYFYPPCRPVSHFGNKMCFVNFEVQSVGQVSVHSISSTEKWIDRKLIDLGVSDSRRFASLVSKLEWESSSWVRPRWLIIWGFTPSFSILTARSEWEKSGDRGPRITPWDFCGPRTDRLWNVDPFLESSFSCLYCELWFLL